MIDLILYFLATSKHTARKGEQSFPRSILFLFQFVTAFLIVCETVKKAYRASDTLLGHIFADLFGRFQGTAYSVVKVS